MYQNDELILEIFRNDFKRTRDVTMFKPNISLDLIENSINIFKEKINYNFNS